MFRRPFNDQEQEFLLKNRLQKPSSELAEELGCSKSKVLNFFKSKGLQLPRSVQNKFKSKSLKGRTSMTEAQTRFIKDNYLHIPIKTLAKMIGKSGTAVRIRLRQLDLKVPKALAEQRKRKNQFTKGQPGWNKGLNQSEYMTPEQIAKSKKTRFKKGSVPHNTKYDGYERISRDGYVEIRVSQGKFRLKHRVIYEENHGKIPKGYVVRFRDGNNRNFEPSNLIAISKEDNLRKNWHDYPKPLKKAIRLTNKINKQL